MNKPNSATIFNKELQIFQDSFFSHFSELEDPRIDRKKLHNLMEILFIAICAFICGANSWLGIVEFAKAKEKWLKKFIKIDNGIPSHVTFWRVFSRLKPKAFENCFINWMKKLALLTKGEIIAIDGKTIRGTYDIDDRSAAIHMVSAWANQNRLILGQVKTEEKSNEITAIPKLLDMIDVKDCTITIDAMGCQKEIAEKIIDNEANYILALKGNQGSLKGDISLFLQDAIKTDFKGIDYDFYSSTEKSHGRIETRKIYVVDNINWLEGKDHWKSLSSIILVESTREHKNKVTSENRYYISNLLSSARQFAQDIREHWGVENSLHWCLDVGFREDRSVSKNAQTGENMSILRRIAFNLFKKDKTSKRSIENKRFRAALNESYLEELLGLN
jgi:predicted transposase YbfD/YdcC